MSTKAKTAWVVMEILRFEETSLALLADSEASAKKGAAKYVGEESLEWEQRNGMFDSQDYFVTKHNGDEYHIYEQEIEHHE